MREVVGDLWQHHAAGAVVAITTHGAVGRSGRSSMQRGCARQARDRFPGIDTILGELVRSRGNHVHPLGERLVSFPVEHDPYRTPELELIERSCRELVALADMQGWQRVVVPRPGCGGGGLSWRDVRPLLARHFDDRFTVISTEVEK